MECIINRELRHRFPGLIKRLLVLSLISLIYWVLSETINSQKIATLLAILFYLLIFCWLIAVGVVINVLYIRNSRNRWKNSVLKTFSDSFQKFYLAFDEEKLYFTSDSYNYDQKWEYFKYYYLKNDILFFIQEDNTYNHIAFSVEEIGTEIFNQLLLIAKKKLEPLTDF